jgi:hypothetical protein
MNNKTMLADLKLGDRSLVPTEPLVLARFPKL